MPARFRIASYNVKDFDSHGVDERSIKKKSRTLKAVIESVDADIIVFQEACSLSAIEMLNMTLTSPYPVHGLVPGNSVRRHHFAFLSRFPVTTSSHAQTTLIDETGQSLVKHHQHQNSGEVLIEDIQFQRDLLRIEVDIDSNQPIAIFVGHFKSQRSDTDPSFPNNPGQDVIRAAECRTAVNIMNQYCNIYPDRPVVLAGDLNDSWNSETLKPLMEDTAWTDIIARDWINAGQHPSYSYKNPPARARLDYLMLSHTALARYVGNSACIHRISKWQYASDHLPISATFDFSDRNISES